MTKFDNIDDHLEDRFARHDPQRLRSIYGTSDVEPYWVADMDFEVAEPIRDELIRLANRARFAYELNSRDVLDVLVDWYRRRHSLQLFQENLTQVPGVLTGIALLIRELTRAGDGILIQTPVYHQFKKLIRSAGRKVVKSPLTVRDGHYRMSFDDLAKQLSSDHVKAMILCNPHNPVGRVWTRDELGRLLELADEHQVFIISDEIHSDIVFSDYRFLSLADFAALHTASLIGSPAKTFGMHSISSGYLYTPNQDVSTKVNALRDSMYLGHGNALGDYATLAAYTEGEPWLDELLEYLEATVVWITDFLRHNMPDVHLFPAEGTYQLWLDFNNTGHSPEAVAKALVDARMGLTPGGWFDSENDLFFRMNIASPLAKIQQSFHQLKKTL